MSKMMEEKQIRKHIENLDRQLVPEALPYPRPGHGGVECPICWRQVIISGKQDEVSVCPFCDSRFRKP